MSSSIHTIHRSVETPNNQTGPSPHAAPDYFSRRQGTGKLRWTPNVVPEERSTGSASNSDGDEEADFEVERDSPDEMDNATILEMPLTAKSEDKGKRALERHREGPSTPMRIASPEQIPTAGDGGGSPIKAIPRASTRSMSIATVRLKRRTKLAFKLREVFGVDGINEVVAGEWNWMSQSQGNFIQQNSADMCCRIRPFL